MRYFLSACDICFLIIIIIIIIIIKDSNNNNNKIFFLLITSNEKLFFLGGFKPSFNSLAFGFTLSLDHHHMLSQSPSLYLSTKLFVSLSILSLSLLPMKEKIHFPRKRETRVLSNTNPSQIKR